MIRSSLKFDGHLLVGKSFETNVECVYAAGPVAKFSNGGALIAPGHAHYNSVEIGARVARMLMRRLDVTTDDDRCVRPLSVYCRLPGKHNFLQCSIPGLKFMDVNTETRVTGDADSGYFEIVTDARGDVLKLSCYSKRVSVIDADWHRPMFLRLWAVAPRGTVRMLRGIEMFKIFFIWPYFKTRLYKKKKICLFSVCFQYVFN